MNSPPQPSLRSARFLAILCLVGCSSAGLGRSPGESVSAECVPAAIGQPGVEATTSAGLPRQVDLGGGQCRYFPARRGTCDAYLWLEYATGGTGDSTLQYFDADGSLVYEEQRYDILRSCPDGTMDSVCRTGCLPKCESVVTETIGPGSPDAPAGCAYSGPGFPL